MGELGRIVGLLGLLGCDATEIDLDRPPPDPPASEAVPDGGCSGIDLLFVVDDSSAMRPLHGRMGAEIGALLEPLASLWPEVEVHVGVTTTSSQAGCGGLGELVSDHCYPRGNFAEGLVAVDPDTLACALAVGTNGSPQAYVREAMVDALVPGAFCNYGFARPEAPLGIVVLTDGPDPDEDAQAWHEAIGALRDDPRRIAVASFAADETGDLAAFTMAFDDRGYAAGIDESYGPVLGLLGEELRAMCTDAR